MNYILRLVAFTLVGATALLSCSRDFAEEPEEVVAVPGEEPALCRTILFHATQAETKARFGDPENDFYPTLWTSNDSEAKISLNYGGAIPAVVTPSQDGASSTLDATVDFTDVDGPYTFFAVSPSSAAMSLSPSRHSWKVTIPCEQSPTAGSVDENAIILAASSIPFQTSTDISDVDLYFSHLTAYGRVSLTGIDLIPAGATVQAIELTATTPLVGDWFWACEPSGGGSHTLIDYGASYTGELAFGGGFSNIHPHTKLVANTRIDLNGACAVIGDTPIDMGWASKAFTDNGTIRWEAPIISMLDMSFLSTLILCASNVDVNASLQYNWTATAGKTIRQKCDLNGYDQHFGKMAVANNYRLEANHYHSVTSATPATLTLKKQDINQVQAFTVDGAASLVMDTAGKTLTMSNVVGQASSTTGGIYAAAGTLALRDRASFANVSEIGAGKRGSDTAATLSVLTSDVRIGPGSVRSNRVVARLDGAGMVSLPADYTLTVYQCLTNGVYLSPGSYTSSTLPARVSGGTLHVMRGEHTPHTMIIFR